MGSAVRVSRISWHCDKLFLKIVVRLLSGECVNCGKNRLSAPAVSELSLATPAVLKRN